MGKLKKATEVVPAWIQFETDGNIAENFIKPDSLTQVSTDKLHFYRYVVSKQKAGMELCITKVNLNILFEKRIAHPMIIQGCTCLNKD